MGAGHSAEILIEPSRRWRLVSWKEIVAYRDLLYLLVRREFVIKYKQTLLGPIWAVVQPLLTAGVFVVIFARVARIPTSGVPPLLFFLAGLVVWTYFSQTLASIAQVLRVNSQLFSKVYFPRLIIPLSVTISGLIPLAIQLLLFATVYLWNVSGRVEVSFGPTPLLFALPLLILQTAALGLGLGLIAAALSVRYRDLSHAIPFLLQLGTYATPIAYPLSIVPEKWRPILALNPVAVTVDLMRAAFFGTEPIGAVYVLFSAVSTLALLGTGLALFNRTERTFVDLI
jgi:lipopolysaccharide transport system permease protein